VLPELKSSLGIANVMQVPGVVKVVVNMASATPPATPSSSTAPCATSR